jgi:hypothetical protein
VNTRDQKLDDAGQLWHQVMDEVARLVSPGHFHTWFPALRFESLEDHILQLTVPNEPFREAFLEHCSDYLREAANRITGSPITLRLLVEENPEYHLETVAEKPLPVQRAAQLETADHRSHWLVERLWASQAVGVIGGNPKCGKTTLALEMAVSVASATPCLGAFPVLSPGPVLLYAAEDSAASLRTRLEVLARSHNLDFQQLDVRVITADSLRLDRPEHQHRLELTVAAHRPALLVLDPLIRLHNLDENQSAPMAALLGYLRNLQRKTGTAIALVHHARKNVSPRAGAGYSLRGSSDLYAWLDSFLYLRKHQDQMALTAEHRSAPPFGPLLLERVQADTAATYLRIAQTDTAVTGRDDLDHRILSLLQDSPEPLSADSLRTHLQIRNQRVVETLRRLQSEGRIRRLARGYVQVS